MPVIMRVLKVYSGASTKECSRKVFFLKFVTASTMRSPAYAANVKKPRKSVRAQDCREEVNIYPLDHPSGDRYYFT